LVQIKAPILIVDGYNIIGSWENLKLLKEKNFGSARDQLISMLAAFYPWCWERIIIVFDGQNFAWDDHDGVEVVFTEANESADTLIERLAAGFAAYYRVEVATSDFAELRAARLARKNKGKNLSLNDLLQQSVIDGLEKLRNS